MAQTIALKQQNGRASVSSGLEIRRGARYWGRSYVQMTAIWLPGSQRQEAIGGLAGGMQLKGITIPDSYAVRRKRGCIGFNRPLACSRSTRVATYDSEELAIATPGNAPVPE